MYSRRTGTLLASCALQGPALKLLPPGRFGLVHRLALGRSSLKRLENCPIFLIHVSQRVGILFEGALEVG